MRKIAYVAAVLALVATMLTPAWAVKRLARITPDSAASQGFKLKITHREKGEVGFELERDLSKKEWPGRSAILRLGNEAKPIARCILEPKLGPGKGSQVVRYRFNVGEEYLNDAHLTYIEVQQGPEGEVELIGGGTYFEFTPLSEFVKSKP